MQKINLKKTTKEQMLNMLETAWQANAGANEEIAALSKRIEEQNDALAKCVAEKNELRDQVRDATRNAENKDLRTKLADAEAALEKANAEVSRLTHELSAMKKAGVQYASAFKYAVEHPFENLWKWVERKLGCAE